MLPYSKFGIVYLHTGISTCVLTWISVFIDKISFCVGVNIASKEFEPPHVKTNNVSVRPVKTQISLGICPV